MTLSNKKTKSLLAALPVLITTLLFFAGVVSRKTPNTIDAASAVFSYFSSFGILFLSSLVSFSMSNMTLSSEWNCTWHNIKEGLICALKIIVLVIPITWVCKLIWTKLGIEIPIQNTFSLLSGDASLSLKILLCTQAILLAPFVEELAYRGVLHTVCKKLLPTFGATLAVALYFATMHATLYAFLPLTLVGFFLARVYDKTKSLCSAFTAHAVFNAISLLAFVLG